MPNTGNKMNIYDQFNKVSQQTHELMASLSVLSEQLTHLLADNARLAIENEHLRDVITDQKKKQTKKGLSDSRKILQRLYQEGFHVCSDMYGKRLGPHESCTFCLDAIYGRHDLPKGASANATKS